MAGRVTPGGRGYLPVHVRDSSLVASRACMDCKESLLKVAAIRAQTRRVLAISRRHRKIFAERQLGAFAFIRIQVRKNEFQQPECLSTGNAVAKGWRVSLTGRPLPCELAHSCLVEHESQKSFFGIGDADNQAPIFVGVQATESDCSFSVDQTRDVGRVLGLRSLKREIRAIVQIRSRNENALPGFLRGTRTFGGGGGTAVPSLSRRAGLCLHPSPLSRRVGCGACYPNRYVPIRILGPAPMREHLSQSMSLYRAGRVGLVPPLGVATSLSRRQGSPNEPRYHFALTSEGNHCVPSHQLNPRPQALDMRIYVRSCFFVFSLSATRRAGKTSSQLQ